MKAQITIVIVLLAVNLASAQLDPTKDLPAARVQTDTTNTERQTHPSSLEKSDAVETKNHDKITRQRQKANDSTRVKRRHR